MRVVYGFVACVLECVHFFKICTDEKKQNSLVLLETVVDIVGCDSEVCTANYCGSYCVVCTVRACVICVIKFAQV